MAQVLVLGAGLQGACAAFALAEAGHRVTVIDREDGALRRASLCNEGKIHLGFVYAHDCSGRTAALMLEAALSFAPLMERWLDAPVRWSDISGRPFSYLALRDSLVPAEKLVEAWERIDAAYAERRAQAPINYLGSEPGRLICGPAANDRLRTRVSDCVTDLVHTQELAIDMGAFREQIACRLAAHPAIECLFDHQITDLHREGAAFRAEGIHCNRVRWQRDAEVVVNCLWEGRLAIDRQMGLLPTRPWVHRLKCRLLGTLPAALSDVPSLTLMCGRFGDVVNFGRRRVYLSWYPACLRGWSSAPEIPAAWDAMTRGHASDEEKAGIVAESLRAFDAIVPGLGACAIDTVDAGVIFSWGQTDIDDPASELHRRDDIGPWCDEGYITVNTGKLTTAPMFGRQIASLVR